MVQEIHEILMDLLIKNVKGSIFYKLFHKSIHLKH